MRWCYSNNHGTQIFMRETSKAYSHLHAANIFMGKPGVILCFTFNICFNECSPQAYLCITAGVANLLGLTK